jgi:ankyrin repeat protein
VNECTENKKISALMYSIGVNDEAFKLLLRQDGIDVNHQSKEGDTALMWAAKKGKPELVKCLLAKGANV